MQKRPLQIVESQNKNRFSEPFIKFTNLQIEIKV